MSEYLLNKFVNKYIIEGQLIAESPISIGDGGNDFTPTAIDNPIIRDKDGKPFIPGTSLKGVLRSFMERLLAGGFIEEFKACNILEDEKDGNCLSLDDIKEIKKNPKKYAEKKGYAGIQELSDQEAIATLIYREECDICKLFGGHGFASKIKIYDSRFDGADGEKPVIQRRDGVSIDRDTLTSKDGNKYEFECVAPGTVFKFEMTIDNLDEKHKKLLKIILNVLKNGELSVGAKTSSGLGAIRLINDVVFKVDEKNRDIYFIEGITKKNKDMFKGDI